MSHAGRRIASTAAAAAAVALPIAVAGSAQADALPALGALPAVGTLTGGGLTDQLGQGLPVAGGLSDASSPLSSVAGATPLSNLPVNNLPAVGGVTSSLGQSNLPVVSGLANNAAAAQGAGQQTGDLGPAQVSGQQASTDAEHLTMHTLGQYAGKHRKA